MSSIGDQYNNLLTNVKKYWSLYGGLKVLLASPYFHISLIITILLWPLWIKGGWWDIVLDILPNLIGFTLGGYAILIAFGDDDFRALISGKLSRKDGSPFMGLNTTFVHFIVVQILSLIVALIGKAEPITNIPIENKLEAIQSLPSFIQTQICEHYGMLVSIGKILSASIWFFGFNLFIYALTLAFAATFAIFHVANWYDLYHAKKRESNESSNNTINSD